MKKCAFLLLWALFCVLTTIAQNPQSLLLKNVVVYDGTGRAPFHGEVRILGDKIVAVGKHLKAKPGEPVRDGGGLALAPGFIDVHSHADGDILDDPGAENAVRQGITTFVGGQDGDSFYPLADFFVRLEKNPPAVNVMSMVGHATMREQVMGKDYLRAAKPEEIQRMKALVAQEMKAGAFGLSTGLEYEVGHLSTTEEVVELSRAAAADGGVYISHVRDEGDHVFDSFQEILTIGVQARLPVEITHIKLGTTSV